jgi:hypothetical protein
VNRGVSVSIRDGSRTLKRECTAVTTHRVDASGDLALEERYHGQSHSEHLFFHRILFLIVIIDKYVL